MHVRRGPRFLLILLTGFNCFGPDGHYFSAHKGEFLSLTNKDNVWHKQKIWYTVDIWGWNEESTILTNDTSQIQYLEEKVVRSNSRRQLNVVFPPIQNKYCSFEPGLVQNCDTYYRLEVVLFSQQAKFKFCRSWQQLKLVLKACL